MPYMSEEFYKFISRKLIEFFDTSKINTGDKYYLKFEKKDQINELFETLKKSPDFIEDINFSYIDKPYYDEEKNKIPAYSLQFENINIFVVKNIDIDNFVTNLRNEISENCEEDGDWSNTALLIIGSNPNDSNESGMGNLESDGMPLSTDILIKDIKDSLYDENNTELSEVDKQIILCMIKEKEKGLFEAKLINYKSIFEVIEKKSIDKGDYADLGLFIDNGLESFKSDPEYLKKRIKDNHEIFEEVKKIKHYDLISTKKELKKLFKQKCIEQFLDENWKNIEYLSVIDCKKDSKPPKNKLKYLESKIDLPYWEKKNNDSASGERNRHFIIFNIDNLANIEVELKFNKSLNNDYLAKEYKGAVDKNSLKINLNVSSKKKNFFRITYNNQNFSHSNRNKEDKENEKNKVPPFTFNIAIVNCDEKFLESIKTIYKIDADNKLLEINPTEEIENISFGNGVNRNIDIKENNQKIIIGENEKITISEFSLFEDSDDLNFIIKHPNEELKIKIKNEEKKQFTKNSFEIWNMKRIEQNSIIYDGSIAKLNTNSFAISDDFKKFIKYEKQLVNKNLKDNPILSGKINTEGIIEKENYHYTKELTDAYAAIINKYIELDNVPSLVYLDSDLRILYKDFLNIFNKEVENIDENVKLNNQEEALHLNKIGVFETENQILISSLSPLNMAYQLKIIDECGKEDIDTNILKRFYPENLIPFIFKEENNQDIPYKAKYQEDVKEWIIYENIDNTVGTTNAFIATVVHDKLKQFVDSFTYLFDKSTPAPIKINIINLKDDKELLKGVINFIYERYKDNQRIIPVEATIYNGSDKNGFEDLVEYTDPDQVKEFGITLTSKGDDSPTDVLNLIQNNITYYKNTKTEENEYEYAHISFYKMVGEEKATESFMNSIDTGLSLNGVISSIPIESKNDNNGAVKYEKGFGSKYLPTDPNDYDLLINTVVNLNLLMYNSRDKGLNYYSKDKSIVMVPNESVEEKNRAVRENLYKKSNWVTFIEPNFTIDYFNDSKNQVIVHYNEQYTSASNYDTITITTKHQMYFDLIRNFLEENDTEITDGELFEIIRIFNSINGEWLLNILSNPDDNGEKLSIISAIKFCLAILDHPEITWIPISMAEIIRIAGSIRLPLKEGVFYNKLKGSYSDDLLFLGIREENKKIKVYFYPIEVKEGLNKNSAINKAKSQILNIYNDLIVDLGKNKVDNLNYLKFTNKFYRNFFMQIALANEQKLSSYHIWNKKQMSKIQKLKTQLLNDDYEVSFELEKFLGIGAIVSFKDHEKEIERTIEIIDIKEDEEDSEIINVLNENQDYKALFIELNQSNKFNGIKLQMEQLYNNLEIYIDKPRKDLFYNEQLSNFTENN